MFGVGFGLNCLLDLVYLLEHVVCWQSEEVLFESLRRLQLMPLSVEILKVCVFERKSDSALL